MAAVLAGDLVVLFAFVATGQYAHSYYFWQDLAHTVLITIPFVLAWLSLASLARLFDPDTLGTYRLTIPLVAGTWIGASLLGGFIRSTALFPGDAPPMFLLANIGFGMLFFVPWRAFVTWRLRH